MRKALAFLVVSILFVLGTGSALAKGVPWKDHAPPFDFFFGNHFDTHQQSKLAGKGQLVGSLYIVFTGNSENGIPVAVHGNCENSSQHDGDSGPCTVGWALHGIPTKARLISKESGMHPTWCIDPANIPPQPGYTHFHWLGASEHAGKLNVGETRDGYLLKLTATDTFFFKHHGGFSVTPGIDYDTHYNIVADCE